jgi:DNA-binding HxlR family transcriptional regulator
MNLGNGMRKSEHAGALRTPMCLYSEQIFMAKQATSTRKAKQSPPPVDEHQNCRALGQVLDRIGDKWTVMVVGALSKGPLRFNALLRVIGGVSHRMLTLTLRALERDGLVKRTVHPTVPPRVEYELTKVGKSLIEPLSSLSAWVQKNQAAIEAARLASDAK